MADKIDMLFTSYFSGELENQIAFRKFELRNEVSATDDNIGGGKLENVNSERSKVESKIIKIDDDELLNDLLKRHSAVRNFLFECDLDLVNMLDYYYDKRKHYVWTKVARLVFKSERQCKYDRNTAKYKFLLKNTWIN